MNGKHRIIVQNKRIRYDFEIKRNLTVIRGDSATGKTALVDMIREFYENGIESGIDLKCDKNCVVLEGKNWKLLLQEFRDSIVFIDEGNNFVVSKEFSSLIQNTDNYYVIVTRESMPNLPYSVEEIYGIRNSGKYGSLKKTYNEFFKIYTNQSLNKNIIPELVITEDSNSGFQFYQKICSDNNKKCLSADGKSSIFKMILKNTENQMLVIADGAAFGPEIERIVQLVNSGYNVSLYLPESFEWQILNAGILPDAELKEILEAPSLFIKSEEYFSWEQYFTALLISKTDNTYLKYSKRILNSVYLSSNHISMILEKIPIVSFEGKKDE